MIRFNQRISAKDAANAELTLTLNFEQRTKGRLKVTLDNGQDAGLFLERGPILRGGDGVSSEDGQVARIVAALETVSTVTTDDTLLLCKVCYHLGNRHTPLEIANAMARYQHDHVLDDMVRHFGLEPSCGESPFEPEPGAYGEHGSDHEHGHSHSHGHGHSS